MSIDVNYESPPRVWKIRHNEIEYFVEGPSISWKEGDIEVIEKVFHDNSVKSALKLMKELESKLIATEKELARVEDKLQEAIWASIQWEKIYE